MIKWFKKLLHIVKHFDDIVDSMERLAVDQRHLEYKVNDAVQTIRDRTTLHADVHMRGNARHLNQIIMIGRYRNRDYIQTFEVHPDDFQGLVRQCIEMQKYAHMGKVDAGFPDMKQIIETESKNYWGAL